MKLSTLARCLVPLAAAVAIAVACTASHAGSQRSHAERLHRLDDSITALAPSALDSIRQGMEYVQSRLAGARQSGGDGWCDSTAYEEYRLRLARYYWLSDNPERADTIVQSVTAFVRRQDNGYYDAHHMCRSPRLNALMAGALSCQAAYNHNFRRDSRHTLRLYSEAYRLLQASDAQHDMPKTCANLADAYIMVNDIPSAAKWYRRALFLVDSLKLPQKENVTLYLGLAQLYMSLHDFEQAKTYYDATERSFGLMPPHMQAYYVNNLGNFYYYTKNYPAALRTFERMRRLLVSRGMQNRFDMYQCMVNMADVYLNLGRLAEARRCLDDADASFRRMNDPIAIYYCNTIRIGIAARAGDTAGVERVLRSERTPKDIPYTLVNIRNSYLRRYYEQTGSYRKAYLSLLDNISYQDSLEHNRSNMRSAEIMARFTADTLALHHDLALEHKNVVIQKTSTMATAAVSVAVVLVLLLAIWMMYTRKKQLQNRVDIMNLKLNNVRNRISPHFMFNVLNNKIVNSGEREASELMELARLIRTNLDMSSQPYMMLDKELDFVRQYIRVERYLLGDDFTFGVDTAPDVDISQVRIPSMFLQILTENAIVHGLKGLDRPKCLHITISRSGSSTVISVTDNGPGFNAHRSLRRGTGLGIISQTIAVANEHNKQKMRFEINNREDDKGRVTGCEATLTVPDNITF